MSTPAIAVPSRTESAGGESVWRRYGEYLRRPPLLSIEWCDQETGARGWLVINSLRNGAAGGGTRMRPGLSRREVVYLAKTMELKFLFSGPPIGGAKSGLDFDPTDPRREQVLRRWFRAIGPQLHHYYGTGGDLNVDEVGDVIPGCEAIGLSHPQEGVVRGHLQPGPDQLGKVLRSLDEGVKAPVSGELGVPARSLPVADLITGYGLAVSILRLYERTGRPIEGTRVLLEGFGAVGGPCALYLARAGARIVGISDREKALVSPAGLRADDVERLVRDREEKCIPGSDPRVSRAQGDPFDGVPADLFIAAAASGTLDAERLARLRGQGVTVLGSGANQPFREAQLGSTTVQREADREFTIIPDVVANCGMARAFSYLMQTPGSAGAEPVFQAVERTIADAIDGILAHNGERSTGLLAATLGYALDRVGDPESTA